MSHTHLLMAYMFSRGNTSEVVIVGKKDNREIKQMIDILHRKFLPRITTVVGYEGENKKLIDSTIEFVAQQKMIDEKSTAYICQNFSCQQPITDVEEFKENIMRI
ncbi:hypothetical protein [Irregularibacter muris]|uniref:hypothetical protein n=1 Tax=Irregularibacter muris TaxID=1796619 RepID=UPI0027D465ED|nr:hypothetical protein [Irregularibacter muris]